MIGYHVSQIMNLCTDRPCFQGHEKANNACKLCPVNEWSCITLPVRSLVLRLMRLQPVGNPYDTTLYPCEKSEQASEGITPCSLAGTPKFKHKGG